MRDKIRVLIADDHPIVRDGIVNLLNLAEHIDVVDTVSNGQEAIDVSLKLKPDVVLMDITMPVMGGLEATKILKEKCPESYVLVLSMHVESEYIRELMLSGAKGYVVKDISPEILLKAIETVFQGQTYFSEGASNELFNNLSDTTTFSLSPREITVLTYIARGFSHKKIANEINRSVRTVEKHRQNIKEKLDIHSTAELTQYAIRHKFI